MSSTSAQGIKSTCGCVCLTWVQLPACSAALCCEETPSNGSALGNFLLWLSQGPAYTRHLGVGQGVKLALCVCFVSAVLSLSMLRKLQVQVEQLVA